MHSIMQKKLQKGGNVENCEVLMQRNRTADLQTSRQKAMHIGGQVDGTIMESGSYSVPVSGAAAGRTEGEVEMSPSDERVKERRT